MKTGILCSFAVIALTLSYFFEQKPANASASGNPAAHVSYLDPNAVLSGEDLSRHIGRNVPTFRDSLFYNYYAQTLGLEFDYSEDKQLIEAVSDWIGTPYRAGSSTRRGTDCSGFVTSIYREVYGIELSRSSRSMFNDVERIKKDDVRTGDLVFFRRSPNQPIYHVGIYLKDGKFVHSATNGGVMVSSLEAPYYKKNYYAAGRVN